MVRARFEHTTARFTCGCNNSNYEQTLNQSCAHYTREAALWATSLTKIEGERPWTFDGVKLIAVDDQLRLFLGHGVWFA